MSKRGADYAMRKEENTIKAMKARDIMTRVVTAATRNALGQEVAQLLLSGKYSGLPVVEPDGTVVGVVTEYDLLKAVHEGKDLNSIAAEELMTPVPFCVEEDATVEEVIEKMTLKNVIRLPVVRNGKVIGLIARADVLTYLVKPEFIRIYGS